MDKRIDDTGTMKLLPCPFCGGEAVRVYEEQVLICGHKYWKISHLSSDCILTSRGFPSKDKKIYYSENSYSTREKAITAWNRRNSEQTK